MDIRTDITAKRLAEHLDVDRLTLKVVEECMELCEVLVKGLTKAEGFKPPVEKIIEEMGDVTFRMYCLAKKLQIEQAVETRVIEKGEQLDKWLDIKLKQESLPQAK